MKILVVEDDEDLCSQYKEILELKNHDVAIAVNGIEGVEKFQAQQSLDPERTPFDVVVLDYMMPEMDGMEVAKKILQMYPKQRIIFASAYVQDTLMKSIKQLNQLVELLQKPFDPMDFVDLIEDKDIYQELEKLNVDIKNLKDVEPTHAQIQNYLEALRKIQKGKNF